MAKKKTQARKHRPKQLQKTTSTFALSWQQVALFAALALPLVAFAFSMDYETFTHSLT